MKNHILCNPTAPRGLNIELWKNILFLTIRQRRATSQKTLRGDVKVEIKDQGAIVINECFISKKVNNDVILVAVYCESKFFQIDVSYNNGIPWIDLYAKDNTVNLYEKRSKYSPTMLAFPEYINHEIFSIQEVGWKNKHTINICFLKQHLEEL